MFDLIKSTLIIMVIWIMWLAIPVAAALVGTFLALVVLLAIMKDADKDFEDE
jgi:hypothetical protein